MKLLRSLIPLGIEDQDEPDTHKSEEYRSAKVLIRPKYMPQSNNPTTPNAYSSIHLSKHHKMDYSDSPQPDTQTKTREEHVITDFTITTNKDEIIETEVTLTLPSEAAQTELFMSSFAFMSDTDCASNTNLKMSNVSLNTCSTSSYTLDSHSDTKIDTETTIETTDYKNGVSVLFESEQSTEDSYDIDIGTFPAEHFKFMYNIGHGAFGIVHKEFHLQSCQIVAIKQCRSNNAASLHSFQKEIALCQEFKECNYIIDMIDYGLIKERNKVCIALEYMNMSSLNINKSIFSNGPLNRIKHVCFCILQALNCLHSSLYVHNDVKPDNILANDHWEVKLTDFGCIKQMKDSDCPLTKPVGTEYYQSYEKRFVSPIEYSTKSDIYSFAITVCELLLEKETLDKSVNAPFVIPSEIIRKYTDTNADLIDFLHKCLDRNCKQRWDALHLLKHTFLSGDSANSESAMDKSEDIDDLDFMTNSLIEYYSHYNCRIDTNTSKNNISVETPIDNAWTDSERLQNIAKASGFSVEFVQDYITQKVTNLKNKYLKL